MIYIASLDMSVHIFIQNGPDTYSWREKNMVSSTFFFLRAVIPWLSTDKSDELLSTKTAFLMCPLVHEKLG